MAHHTRSEVSNGRAKLLKPMPLAETLKLSIVLPLRNQNELDELLRKQYDPQSSEYHNWLGVSDFDEKFGPSREDYELVGNFMEAHGLKVTSRSQSRMVLDVEGTVANINRTLHVNMGVYRHPVEDRTFFAPDREPSLDLGVQLWRIAGLDNFSLPHSNLHTVQKVVSANVDAGVLSAIGTGPEGSYTGSDIRAAYYGGTALNGAGQTIGIYGLNYNLSDVELYFSTLNQSFNPASLTDYSTDGTVGNSCGPSNNCTNDGEPVADIVQALSMAPGASIVEFFGSNDVDTYNAMATYTLGGSQKAAASQLSQSVSWLPADPSNDEKPFFQRFASQGQNLFVATGDDGAYGNISWDSNTNQWDTTVAWYPADDPYITAVGGTDLYTSTAGGPWSSETAWIDGGGGISTNNLGIPTYQQLPGVIDSLNGGSTTLRNVPDVSADANFDSFYCVMGTCPTIPNSQGVYYLQGGTSLAAPRWAGFLALVNEQSAQSGKPSLGFLNPTIYAIGTGPSYDSDLHDIELGNNNAGGYGLYYNAVAGYDLATGWGSPNSQNTIDALSGVQPPFACHIEYTIYSQWINGNGTAGFDAGITIENTGTIPISNWTLTWSFSNGQTFGQYPWNGTFSQNGANVTVNNMSYNGRILAGSSYTGVGFTGTWNGVANAVPTAFTVNGTPCN